MPNENIAIGTPKPDDDRFVMGSNNQWVLVSTTGAGGLNDPNAGVDTTGGEDEVVVDPVEETAGSIYDDAIPGESKEEKRLRELRDSQAEEAKTASESVVDEEAIRAATIKRFQAEIDSLNSIYAEQKRKEEIAGRGRVGSSTAIQARRGLIGSTFGDTQSQKVNTLNADAQAAIDAEKNFKIQQVHARIRAAVSGETKAKELARKQGSAKYLEFLEDQVKRSEAVADEAINNMIAIEAESGTEIGDEDWESLADALNMSVEQVKRMYGSKKAEAGALADQAQLDRSKVLKPGEQIIDPATGEVLGSVPAAPKDPAKPITQVFGNEFRQWNPTTGGWDLIATKTDDGEELTISQQLALYKEGLIIDDNGNIVDDPLVLTKEQIKQGDIDQQTMKSLSNKMKMVEDLINSEGFSGAVGTTPFDTLNQKGLSKLVNFITPTKWIDQAFEAGTSDVSNYIAGIKQLIDKETLDTLIQLKSTGATLGAISEKELDILQSAASRINQWQVKDGDDKVIKYNVTEKVMREELRRIYDAAQVIYGDLAEGINSTLDSQIQVIYGSGNTAEPDELDSLLDEGSSDSGVFNNVGSDTNKATSWLNNYGAITGVGSPLWKWGLDIDVAKGDPIFSPVAGTVVQASDTGNGFGIRVGIKTSQGNIVYLSHNDAANVKVGDVIKVNQNIAKGGNTGNTIPGPNGDGSHIDLTVQKPDGSYFTPQEIKSKLA